MKRILVKVFLPFYILKSNKDLFKQLISRDVESKYRGSYLGILWNFLTPLLMLAVYTFVFGVVFKAKWEYQITNNKAEFALTLFSGIIMYNFFSEALNRAPSLILSNVNYVKKVIFPIELLSISNIGSLLVQMGFNLIIIILGKVIFLHSFSWKIIIFPLILIPLIFLTLGMSWLFSAVGVFIRDMQQTASIIVLVLGYMTPVFYPITLVPEKIRWIMRLNPLTFIVDSGRKILIYNILPDVHQYLLILFISYLIMMLGLKFFRKVKSDFSDAL